MNSESEHKLDADMINKVLYKFNNSEFIIKGGDLLVCTDNKCSKCEFSNTNVCQTNLYDDYIVKLIKKKHPEYLI